MKLNFCVICKKQISYRKNRTMCRNCHKKTLLNTPGWKARLSERAKKLWASPEYRKKWVATRKKRLSDPQYQKNLKQKAEEGWRDPEKRAKWESAMSHIHGTPEWKAALKRGWQRSSFKARPGDPITRNGRIWIYCPCHPFSDSRGWVKRSRWVLEQKIGRFLESKEIAHHINKNQTDDRPENLQIMGFAEHTRWHQTIGRL